VVLAHVGAEGDDVEALFAEPFEDDGGVEAAGVGEDYFGVGFAGHDDDDMIVVLSTEVIMRALVIDWRSRSKIRMYLQSEADF